MALLKRILAAICVLVPVAAFSAPARVVDGDTLSIGDTTFRLNGIDAPEYGQICGNWNCGEAALERLSALVSGQLVHCDPIGEDSYGRTIATCFVGESDIGAEMVRSGYAWVSDVSTHRTDLGV